MDFQTIWNSIVDGGVSAAKQNWLQRNTWKVVAAAALLTGLFVWAWNHGKRK